MGDHEPNDQVQPRPRTMRDYAQPHAVERGSIIRPAVQANNFEIKPGVISMLKDASFGGSQQDDPHWHITSFLEICDTFRYNGISNEAVRLRLFPFSLRDKARSWLNSLPEGSITTWAELLEKFLAKYFPPSKTIKMRNDITSFRQHGTESMYEAWERFKELQRLCPHHEIPNWMLVQIFYDGLTDMLRPMIDAAAGGTILNKIPEEAMDLFEQMANNGQGSSRGRVGLHSVSEAAAINVKLDMITRELAALKTTNQTVAAVCDSCTETHPPGQCFAVGETANFMGGNPRNNPYSNTYNPGWRNHPNFGWRDQNQQGPRPPFPQNQPPRPPQGSDKLSHIEELLSKYISKTDTLLQNQSSSLKNLETQVGQLARAMNSRPQGTLPSNTEVNPRNEGHEQVQAVSLRNGRQLFEVPVEKKQTTVETEDGAAATNDPAAATTDAASGSEETVKLQPFQHRTLPDGTKERVYPPLPFPQRAKKVTEEKQ